MPERYKFGAKLAGEFKNFPVLLLLAATIIAVLLDEVDDAVAIALVAVLHAVLHSGQEVNKGRTLAALEAPATPQNGVRRAGKLLGLPARESLPGVPITVEVRDDVQDQKKLAVSGKELHFLVIGFCLLVFLFGLFRGYNAYEMFLVAVGLAVVVPDGLPALVGFGLALGLESRAEPRLEMFPGDGGFGLLGHAGQEGRENLVKIKKAAYFVFSCLVGEILIFSVALLIGWPLPLAPLHLLWISLVTKAVPTIALRVEPPTGAGRQRLPFPPEQGLFGFRDKITVAVYGIFLAAITLLGFRLGMRKAVVTGQTVAFATSGLGQLVQAFNLYSSSQAGSQRGLFAHRHLLFGTGGAFLLQLSVFFIPLLGRLFRVQGLSPTEWLTVFSLMFTLLIFGMLWKYLGEKLWGKE